MKKKDIINRLRGRLLQAPGAQKGFVRLYICEAELYRLILERIPSRVLSKTVQGILKDLDKNGVSNWFGGNV
jgi:hypothetical protein